MRTDAVRRWAAATLCGLLVWPAPASAAARSHHAAPQAAVKERPLLSFGAADAGPMSGVTRISASAFVATSDFGGSKADGTAFELLGGASGYTTTNLHVFGRGQDGSKPAGGLALDAAGNLYGATIVGGTSNAGVIFELMKQTDGYTYRVLYDFRGGIDGNQPIGTPVLDAAGDIFGVTQFGGESNNGTVFELKDAGGKYVERVLHSFAAGTDGYLPQAGLTVGANGVLYGTTYYGGSTTACENAGCGIVFALSPSYRYRVLHTFRGADGANPFAPLTVSSDGNIFGTTEYGGTGCNIGCGTIFRLQPAAQGHRETVLHSFTSKRDGFLPEGGLLLVSKALYGTASIGGIDCNGIGCGTVVSVSVTGTGFRVLHDFTGPPDGAGASGTTLLLAGGKLLGTTASGGTMRTCADGGPGGVHGCGTFFEASL